MAARPKSWKNPKKQWNFCLLMPMKHTEGKREEKRGLGYARQQQYVQVRSKNKQAAPVKNTYSICGGGRRQGGGICSGRCAITWSSLMATQLSAGKFCIIGTSHCKHPFQCPRSSIRHTRLKIRMNLLATVRNCNRSNALAISHVNTSDTI